MQFVFKKTAKNKRKISILKRFSPAIIPLFFLSLWAVYANAFSSVRLIINKTDSLPHGVYLVRARQKLDYNDLVCFSIPENVRSLISERRWMPDYENLQAFLIKTIAALPGDAVCFKDHTITLRGTHTLDVLKQDSSGRPLPCFKYCGTLPVGKYFVAQVEDRKSFDSRYFGPIDESRIMGVAEPLWIF
jgi:conjugative transfer signal peptidase TraF